MNNTVAVRGPEEDRRPGEAVPWPPRVPLSLGWYLVIAALIGIYSSAMITIDRIRELKDPTFTAACDINSVIACSDVASSPQAEVLGFPNSIVGLIGFGVVAGVGVSIVARARLSPWLWFCLELGSLLAVISVHWFVHAAVFELRALCLYCMCVWVVTVPLFVYITAFNLGTFGPPQNPVVRGIVRFRHVIAWGWVVVLGMLVLNELRPLLFP